MQENSGAALSTDLPFTDFGIHQWQARIVQLCFSNLCGSMAPSLARKAETSLSISASSSLVGSLGSAVPVVLMILLLLLCFPCKRKKRQLSTRVLKRERNSSQLLHMTKLEDEPSPERKSLEDENMHKGNVLPHQQDKKQLNMNGAELRHGNANSPKDRRMAIRKHQMVEKSPKLEVEHLRGSGSPASGPPNMTTPNAVQLRKLPMTPQEVHISRTEPPNKSMDNQVYESICLKETDLCSRDRLVGTKDSDVTSGGIPKGPEVQEPLAGSVGSSETDSRTAKFNGTLLQAGTNVPLDQLPGQSQETGSEMVPPLQPVFDPEKRLSTLYARVRKRPKASSQPQAQPLSHDKSMEEEEEEPPPIPEKRFGDVYESLCVETEVQVGHLPGTAAMSPTEA